MGPEPPHIVDPEKLPAQGRATAHQEASEAGGGGGMVLSSTGGSDGGSGFRGDHGIYHQEEEYGCTIYYDEMYYGHL